MHFHYSNHKFYAICIRTSEIGNCCRLRVPTSLTQTQGLSANLAIYKIVIDLLRQVVTELNKLQAYRTFRARGGAVVKAVRYNPEGHGFDFRWCHWNFSLALGLTQPLT